MSPSALVLDSPLLGVACAASTHGMTDAMHPIECLWPYGVLFLPTPPALTTAVFFLASILHFGDDIGILWSSVLHVSLFSAANRHRRIASTLGCLYYTAIHVPLHLRRHWNDTPLARGALIASCGLFPLVSGVRRCRMSTGVQRLVIGHVGVDIITSRSTARRRVPSHPESSTEFVAGMQQPWSSMLHMACHMCQKCHASGARFLIRRDKHPFRQT